MPKTKPKSRATSTTKTKVTVGGGRSGRAMSFWQNSRNRWVVVIAFVAIGLGSVAWSYAMSASYTLWSPSATPKVANYADPKAVEVGVKFRSKYAGNVTGVRFYKGTQNTGTHTGSVWSSAGKELGSVTFMNESASGWQQANFSQPVNISANTTYVVSYYAPHGYYSADAGYFKKQHKNGPLTALKDGVDGGNGVYLYSNQPAFPAQTYGSNNYWVDVVFTTSRLNPSPQPLAPSNLQASVANGMVTLNWQASTTSGIAKYDILRGGTALTSVAGTVTTYADSQVTAGNNYSYQVEAVDGNGNVSKPTDSVSVSVPSAPGGGGTTPPPANGKNCASKPSSCGYPDDTNTGWQHTGVTLKTVTQDPYVISTPGAVVSGLDIRGCVEVEAQNVTIKDSKITCDNQPMVKNFQPDGKGNLIDIGSGLLMQDVEFDGEGNVDSAGVAFDDYTIIRGNFHNIGAAVKLGDNVDIEDSYEHDLASSDVSHNSGFPSDGGSNITLRHNTVLMNTQNGFPVALYNAESPGVVVKNVTVDDNLLAGGNYLIYCGTPGKITPNLTVTNNRFSKLLYPNGGFYGPTANCDGAAQWSNNYWDDTLAPVGN